MIRIRLMLAAVVALLIAAGTYLCYLQLTDPLPDSVLEQRPAVLWVKVIGGVLALAVIGIYMRGEVKKTFKKKVEAFLQGTQRFEE